MKFDLHCHTKEGSLDSKVSVQEYVYKFMTLGYDGFMISDHNSYKGCKAWDKLKTDTRYALQQADKDCSHLRRNFRTCPPVWSCKLQRDGVQADGYAADTQI